MHTLGIALSVFLSAQLPFGHEHSGIDFDRQGAFYTHPDSGNTSHLYKFTTPDKGQWIWLGLPNIDWEDISIGDCLNLGGTECIYLADMGQNYRRHQPTIYEIDANNTDIVHAHRVSFEHGKNDDVEAIAINNGSLYAIKKNGRRELYKLEGTVFKQCGTFDDGGVYVTGMDMDGDDMVISYHRGRDYFLKEYTMNGCEVLSSRELSFHSKRQVEGVAYDGLFIVAVAEDGMVFRIPR